MTPDRLVLFDIDGTLLSAAGAGRVALQRALGEVVGEVPAAASWSFAGKTDPQITREVLVLHGLETAAATALVPQILERYLAHLPTAMQESTDAHLKPGVVELLDALAREPRVCLGLLTGNLVEGARLKLNYFGLAERFSLGAYGSDHGERYQLPAIAVQRAKTDLGLDFTGKEVVIIGDTEHDVLCGASIGVKAIAVATGPHGVAVLATHGPDHVFADFTDTQRVVAAILD